MEIAKCKLKERALARSFARRARARWLGELAVQESKLAWVSRPDKTRQGCKRHERGGSANLRCRKVSSHGLADPARLQEARARWLGEHAVQESKLARVRRPGKIAEKLADPARLQEARARWLGELAVQESKLVLVSRPGKARARWLSEIAVQESKLARVSRSGKVVEK
ncbi:hypothetical protein CRG98_021376 [Punica granatum]|uniref:Uncharacterized protein n=1 Tax=Punica granatum TaxID=22663 RepID=A0A2I0JPK3_PUNGR|nr:hypothetical protein CRG98_021376 [Punica granatum]